MSSIKLFFILTLSEIIFLNIFLDRPEDIISMLTFFTIINIYVTYKYITHKNTSKNDFSINKHKQFKIEIPDNYCLYAYHKKNDFAVKGTSYRLQNCINFFTNESKYNLIAKRELNNKYDENTIAVYGLSDYKTKEYHLGYIPTEVAEDLVKQDLDKDLKLILNNVEIRDRYNDGDIWVLIIFQIYIPCNIINKNQKNQLKKENLFKFIFHIAKIDGNINAKERMILRETIHTLFNEEIDDNKLKKIYPKYPILTIKEFKELIPIIKSDYPDFNILKFAEDIINTQKTINPEEQEILNILREKK